MKTKFRDAPRPALRIPNWLNLGWYDPIPLPPGRYDPVPFRCKPRKASRCESD